MPSNPHDELAEHYLTLGREQAEVELVKRLVLSGLDSRTVESLTGVPQQQVIQILNVHFNGKIRIPEDDELIEQARRLAKKVLSRADLLIDTAPLPVQINLMKSIMPAIGRMIGNDAGSSFEEARAALATVLASQRVDAAGPSPILSRPSGPATPLIPTDDPDQGFNP